MIFGIGITVIEKDLISLFLFSFSNSFFPPKSYLVANELEIGFFDISFIDREDNFCVGTDLISTTDPMKRDLDIISFESNNQLDKGILNAMRIAIPCIELVITEILFLPFDTLSISRFLTLFNTGKSISRVRLAMQMWNEAGISSFYFGGAARCITAIVTQIPVIANVPFLVRAFLATLFIVPGWALTAYGIYHRLAPRFLVESFFSFPPLGATLEIFSRLPMVVPLFFLMVALQSASPYVEAFVPSHIVHLQRVAEFITCTVPQQAVGLVILRVLINEMRLSPWHVVSHELPRYMHLLWKDFFLSALLTDWLRPSLSVLSRLVHNRRAYSLSKHRDDASAQRRLALEMTVLVLAIPVSCLASYAYIRLCK